MKRRQVYLGTAVLVAGAALLAAGYGLGRVSRPEENVARSTRRTVYVIQEFTWRWRSNRAPAVLDEGRPGRPVAAFADENRASTGVLLLAHGGQALWNQTVHDIAAQVDRRYPTEVAFGMASKPAIADAL